MAATGEGVKVLYPRVPFRFAGRIVRRTRARNLLLLLIAVPLLGLVSWGHAAVLHVTDNLRYIYYFYGRVYTAMDHDGSRLVWAEYGPSRDPAMGVFMWEAGKIRRVNGSVIYNRYPDVHAGHVVWEGLAPASGTPQVYSYYQGDLRALGGQFPSTDPPSVYGTKVVWSAWDGRDTEIFLYDGQRIVRLTDNAVSDRSPKIWDDLVVWVQGDGDSSEIMAYRQGTVRRLTANAFWDGQPQVYEGNVVWCGYDGHDCEIFLWDGRAVRRLTDDDWQDIFPQVYGSRVVWGRHDGNDWEVVLWDGQAVRQLTSNSTEDIWPVIDREQVAWLGFDGKDYEVFFYSDGRVWQMTSNDANEIQLVLRNGRMAWVAGRSLLLWVPDAAPDDSPLTRAELAERLARKMNLAPSEPEVSAFSDVPPAYWAAGYICALVERGIMAGYPDGLFRPELGVTRAEFAAVVCKAFAIQPYYPATPSYQDVPRTHWAYGYVEALTRAKAMEGFAAGFFGPEALTTRAVGLAALEKVTPPLPAAYYGSVKDVAGRSVSSGKVEAYIEGRKAGEIEFSNGFYGGPGGLDPKLVVSGSEADRGKPVSFRVMVGGQTFEATPAATVLWEPGDVRRVDLTVRVALQPQVVLALPAALAGAPGSTVTVPVTVREGAAVAGFQFTLSWGAAWLTEPRAEKGSLIAGDANWSVTAEPGNGTIRVMGYNSAGRALSASDGELVRLTFKVAQNAPSGAAADLRFSGATVSDANAQSLPVATADGRITVAARKKGDVNGDGQINVLDVVRAVNIALGRIQPTDEERYAADANGDGVINVLDVVRIVNMALGRV